MNKKYFSALTLFALVIAAGCSQNDTPGSAAPMVQTPVAEEVPPAAAPIKSSNNMLTADPGAAGCDKGSVIKFRWDVSSNPAVTAVELRVGNEADSKLFAAGGPTGEAETGSWVYSGATFVLRNKSDQMELDRIVIPGPACPPPVETASQ